MLRAGLLREQQMPTKMKVARIAEAKSAQGEATVGVAYLADSQLWRLAAASE
jgi:hypothetical protein